MQYPAIHSIQDMFILPKEISKNNSLGAYSINLTIVQGATKHHNSLNNAVKILMSP